MKISKIQFAKVYFMQNSFGVSVIDLSEKIENLRLMTFQFWFKTGFGISYLLKN